MLMLTSCCLSGLTGILASNAFLAYVGPGAGLTMLGALGAVICVILLALVAPILYPVMAIRAWLKSRPASESIGTTPKSEVV